VSKVVRIGNASAFWGDNLDTPRRLLEGDRVDYVGLDFLAELTMSILRKQADRDPARGYARDAIQVFREILPLAAESGTKIVTNAGGLNPRGCAEATIKLVEELGLSDRIRVAVVEGDDILPRLSALRADGCELANFDTGRSFDEVEDRVISANAYIGARHVRDALQTGADVVIAGRITDTALTLGPLMYEHGWAEDDWDRLAAGIVAGHLIECGTQVSGGNHQADWQTVPDLENVGSPIAEVEPDGSMTITKARDTGGRVSIATVTEQALYEIGDPQRFLTPDVTVDWTSLALEQAGPDRVRVTRASGAPAPPTLKVSASYRWGFSTTLNWLYAWPDPVLKARAAEDIITKRIERLGLDLADWRSDLIGTGAVHGARWDAASEDPAEVILRVAARSKDRASISRLAKEVGPMLFGPPGLAGYPFGGRGVVSEVVKYWPALVPREAVERHVAVTLLEAAPMAGQA